MTEISVRPALAEDAALLAALHRASFEAEPGEAEIWSAEVMGQLLRGPGTLALIADLGDSPAGLVIIRGAADEAEILTIGVDVAMRRQGCAVAMMTASFAFCRGCGVAKLFLEVAKDNDKAKNLYRNLGFIEVGRRANYYRRETGGRVDALIWSKNLAFEVSSPELR